MTKEQSETLTDIISTLNKWLEEGMPDGALVRIWIPCPDTHEIESHDVAHKLLIDTVKYYISQWQKDIAGELLQGRADQKKLEMN